VAELTALATAAAAKAFFEHGIVKPLFYVGVKLPTRIGIEGYNLLAPRRGFAPVAPNAWYYPHWDHFNWGDRNRTRANGNSDRPNWMNWFWDPEAARYWGPRWGWRAAAPGGRGAGNFRIAEQRLRLRHLPKLREFGDSGSDKFNPDTMYEPKKAHSARWYQEARKWISQQIVKEFEATVEYALTPRLNAAGTHFIHADGTHLRPVNPNANGVITNAPTAADFVGVNGVNAINDAHRAAAAAYYPNPELWLALNNPDADIRGKTNEYIMNTVKTHWMEQHYKINEAVRMQVAYEHIETLKRNHAYIKAWQDWVRFLEGINSGGLFKFFFNLVEVIADI